MKYPILITAFLCCAINTFSQFRKAEFTPYANGLVYDDTTVSRLKHIVDSMHSRYPKSNQQKSYYSRPQTKGHYITLGSGIAKQALLDIQNNIPLQDFVKKYRQVKMQENLLIVLLERTYAGKKEFRYTPFPMDDENYSEIVLDADKPDLIQTTGNRILGRTGNWVYSYRAPDNNYSEEINAFYIDTPLKMIALPERYAAMLRYADYMIDPATCTFFPTAKNDFDFTYDGNKCGPKYEALKKYVQGYTRDSISAYIGKQLSKQPPFKKVFTEAVKEALQLQYPTSFWFETATEKYYSKKEALTLKRNRYVYDRCGRDQVHWPHVFDITQLAAETANWNVFIRAHLDLMNSRPLYPFNYYGKGNGYPLTKELELLGINIYDLLLAISLNIGDAAPGHYAANLEFICRAFSKSKDRDRLELALLSMVADSELDDFNRIRMHYLYLNYLHYNQGDLPAMLEKLKDADKKFSYHIYSRLITNIQKGLYLINPD